MTLRRHPSGGRTTSASGVTPRGTTADQKPSPIAGGCANGRGEVTVRGFRVRALLLTLVAVLGSCADEGEPAGIGSGSTAAPRGAGAPTEINEVVERIGGVALREIHPDVGPRRAAADRGLVCTTSDGSFLHIFARSDSRHGSTENIDRLMSTGTSAPGCDVSVLLTERFWLVGLASDLAAIQDEMGGALRPIEVASPTVSYLSSDCDLAPHRTWEIPTDISLG